LSTLRAALGLALAIAAHPALAQPEFLAPVEGDWFDPARWSSGAVPTAADAPFIVNGATARASSSSPFYPGGGTPVEVESLGVGSGAARLALGGRLELQDLDLWAIRGFTVGGNGVASGSAWGALDVTGGRQAAGDVRVGSAAIGFAGGSQSTATGSAALSGDLIGVPAPPGVPPPVPPRLWVGAAGAPPYHLTATRSRRDRSPWAGARAASTMC
jgi:hypothetical protein